MVWTVVHRAIVVIGICLCSNLVQSTFYNVGVKYKVTLNVFSGNEDPDWDIDRSSPLYNRIASLVNEGSPTEFDDGLGYRGFTIKASNAMGQTAWKTVGRYSNRQLESILLRSCPSEGGMNRGISRRVYNHVHSGIIGQYRGVSRGGAPVATVMQSQPRIARVSVTTQGDDDGDIVIHHRIYTGRRKKRQARTCSTSFQPENWNYPPVQRRNNCYNYATNIQTNTFAQPGRGSGRKFRQNLAHDVYSAAVRDGLTSLRSPDAGRQCLIALVIWEYEDFHFLRLDNSGYWSQKSGRTPARNVDGSGNMITDPRNADRGPYTVFGGFLGVGPNVNIR